MKEKVSSLTTGKTYCPSDVVRIVNYKQAAAYMNHGAELLDIYGSRDYKTEECLLVYIFSRADTATLYDLWCKHELK